MNKMRRKILMLAPGCDGNDVGESWSCFKWVSGVAEHHDVTLLTLQRTNQQPIEEQIPNASVVSWPDLDLPRSLERFQSMAKPGYLRFYREARKWMLKAQHQGTRFDVVHQVGPLALRYASPAADMSWPFIVGPLAGSLKTPAGFRMECSKSDSWFTRLRAFDRYRLKFDRLLRRSYERASIVLGVAPYVGELLAGLSIKQIEYLSETGICDLAPKTERKPLNGLRLLYVGRLVRTKGLRDLIRAMGMLGDVQGLTLDVAGTGKDEQLCREEVSKLQLNDKVRFHGQIAREDVEALYQRSDLFVFPSFREPSGNVVFEAMRHGLPVITTNRGGPGFVINDESGIRLHAHDPQQLATDLATAIRKVAVNPAHREQMSAGARSRVEDVAFWPKKIQRALELYEQVCTPTHSESGALSYVH